MIIVISPEKDIPNEAKLVNQLFAEGLAYFHLRKPDKDYKQHVDYIHTIEEQYHNRIVVHYFHELVNEFNLKGIHFQEQTRIDNIDNPGRYFKNLNLFGKTISSSFHDPKDLEDCYFEFDYHLLSPVFASISNTNVSGRGFNVTAIDKLIIGMEGVTADNISKFTNLGYKGVGVLGGIWSSKTPIAVFNKMKQFYS